MPTARTAPRSPSSRCGPWAALVFAAALPVLAAPLPDSIRKLLHDAGISEDGVGVLVLRAEDGTRLLSHNPEASLQPGSTMKVVTTLAALENLGPNWRGHTELRTSAPLEDGVLRGDLILRGGADPEFGWEALRRLLEELRDRGVREIAGDLVVDLSLFRPTRFDIGVPPFDDKPERYYNPIPDALSLNMYLVRLDLESNGQGLAIRATPRLEGVAFVSEMTLVDRPCVDWEDGWKTPKLDRRGDGTVVVRLQGQYPKNCTDYMRISTVDRMEYIDRLFRTLWKQSGGAFRGATREGVSPSDARVLVRRSSRALGQMLHDVNKPSDNPRTRLLYLAMGVANGNAGAPDPGPTLARSEQAVRGWFDRKAIAQEGLVLDNGSGLSRSERIRPAQLAGVLQAGLRSDYAPELLASLPIVGLDGTMRTRLRATPAAGRARIKTGTLDNVVAIAGYVPDASNRTRIVVAIINAPRARIIARPILDALVDWVARSGAPRAKSQPARNRIKEPARTPP